MTTAPANKTVLVVDDEPDVREMVRAFLELNGFDVVAEAIDGCEALKQYLALDPPPVPDVVVLDNRMPTMTGLEAARIMLERHPEQLVVMFSAHLDPAMLAEAKQLGVAACLDKTQPARLPRVLHELLAA
jgi:CheY-like chemotaxis protein